MNCLQSCCVMLSIFVAEEKQNQKIMPHIAVSMLPWRSREVKQELAERLCNTLRETLDVDEKFISVSMEDVELKDWDDSMKRFPEENMFITPKNK